MINSVSLVGRLTKDIELRYSNNNNATTNFQLAVNRPFPDNNGQYQADFISCVAFGKRAENMASYLAKGSLIGVEGRIQTSTYKDKQNKTVFRTDVICSNVSFLESSNKNNNQGNNNFQQNNQNYQNYQNGRSGTNYNNRQQNNNGFDNPNFNSEYSDFGQDFPSNLNDDDFFKDVVNPFKD